MERLVGKYCIIKYLNKLYLYKSFTLRDLNFYKRQIREQELTTTIQYDKNLDFYRVIIIKEV